MGGVQDQEGIACADYVAAALSYTWTFLKAAASQFMLVCVASAYHHQSRCPSIVAVLSYFGLRSNGPIGGTLHARDDARRATVSHLASVHLRLLCIVKQVHGINRKASHLRQGCALLLFLENKVRQLAQPSVWVKFCFEQCLVFRCHISHIWDFAQQWKWIGRFTLRPAVPIRSTIRTHGTNFVPIAKITNMHQSHRIKQLLSLLDKSKHLCNSGG